MENIENMLIKYETLGFWVRQAQEAEQKILLAFEEAGGPANLLEEPFVSLSKSHKDAVNKLIIEAKGILTENLSSEEMPDAEKEVMTNLIEVHQQMLDDIYGPMEDYL